MINSDNLCMSCMRDIGTSKQCPHCGFHVDSMQIEPYLPIRTVLGNRYLVGKLLEYNGDGATYMGLDLSTREAVNIREYFPQGIASRNPQDLSVSPLPEYVDIYNECLQSFIEMWRRLMRLSGLSALIKVRDTLEGNGTFYAITENIDGITLREYLLRNNVGYISWEKARPLLMPVLSTLGTLHASGIVHRGISPSTLVVAPDGKIRITGFSISHVRSARGELKSQLYPGYAAFEQYGYDGRQGTWTDIYGFGAVLYRTLIGTDPIDSKERVTNDRLMVPGKFAEQLPAYVINGLVNALQILPEDRTRTVEELRAELSASPSAAAGGLDFEPVTPVMPKRSAPQRIVDEEDYTYDKRETAKKRHNRSSAVIAIATVVIVLAIGFLVLWQTGVIKLDENTTTTTASETVEVPNFVGKTYDEIIESKYNTDNFVIEKVEEYSSEIKEGYVIRQSLDVNQQVPKNTTIKLWVSKGKQNIVYPTSGVVGRTYEEAYAYLTSLGFKVEKNIKLNVNGETPNTVQGSDHTPGESYDVGETVFLFVWGEPQTTEPTTTDEPFAENPDDPSDSDGSTDLSDILGIPDFGSWGIGQ